MFSLADTIAAIATPPGRGGIGIVRLSGPAARKTAEAILTVREPLVPRYATFTHVKSETVTVRPIDQVIATLFQGPASYTGEDVVEISAHGSPVVLREILSAATRAGVRLAQPGEFTLRAFLNGRLDLVQAEAVADLINAVTPLQARAAYDQLEGTLTEALGEIDRALFDLVARFEASVDFPEEGYHFVEPDGAAAEIATLMGQVDGLLATARRGRLIREGATVVLAGRSNVGKSSLFNALVGTERAIVDPVPGTTRDFITELLDLDGFRLTIVDTAGDRAGADDIDRVERAGVVRAQGARSIADLVLVVLDQSQKLDEIDRAILERTTGSPRLVVANKCDLPAAWTRDEAGILGAIVVSSKTREGLDELRSAIAEELGAEGERLRDCAAVTNIRHIALLERVRTALRLGREAIESSNGRLSEEFVLADLQDARAALEEITGKRSAEDLLEHIFSNFCIGK